jgi:hypothetical protein
MSLYTIGELVVRLQGMTLSDPTLADGQVIHEAAEALLRLSRPYHEREPPHCPTCDCNAEPQTPPRSDT